MNNDLISRTALLEAMPKNDEILSFEVRRVICDAPAVDAVPVIRCRDCEEYIPWGDRHICGLIGSYFGNTKPNYFCSRGRRKKAGE